MSEIIYIKRTVMLTPRHIEIINKLRAVHDREFSAQVRSLISEAEKQLISPEPSAAKH